MTDREKIRKALTPLRASDTAVQEVLEMIREQNDRKTRRHPVRTGVLIAFAAALLIGSAFAAVGYKLHADRLGELAVAISVAEEGSAPGAVAFSGEAPENVRYTGLDAAAGWLPEGMTLMPGETTKWMFEDNWDMDGFSIMHAPLDAGNATFCEVVTDAENQETMDIGGHEAIYVKTASNWGFNQRIYIAYPEYNAVMTIYVGADVTRDDAMKFAENLIVTPGDREIDAEDLAYSGKRYLDAANFIATGVYVNTADEIAPEDVTETEAAWWARNPANRAAQSGMADAHEIGESFPVTFMDFNGGHKDGPFVDLAVKVTDISVRDDISALRDAACLERSVAALLDENGKLPREDYDFVKFGDGVSTPGVTTVATLPDQQLYMVAATVEVTNTTDETIAWAGYSGLLLSVAETPEGWAVTSPRPEDPSVEYDEEISAAWIGVTEMKYWDLRDPNSNGGNEIADLAPGETVTIQMGFVVSECQLGDLWFYMNDMDVEGPDEIHVGYVPVPLLHG